MKMLKEDSFNWRVFFWLVRVLDIKLVQGRKKPWWTKESEGRTKDNGSINSAEYCDVSDKWKKRKQTNDTLVLEDVNSSTDFGTRIAHLTHDEEQYFKYNKSYL